MELKIGYLYAFEWDSKNEPNRYFYNIITSKVDEGEYIVNCIKDSHSDYISPEDDIGIHNADNIIEIGKYTEEEFIKQFPELYI